uniref:(northern house mosquito) hypothetical protein n=1 Tax=Culex pipiens TaxID=7175 RepID=A0A8D8K538_CULPI
MQPPPPQTITSSGCHSTYSSEGTSKIACQIGNRMGEGASKRHLCFIFYGNTSLVGVVIRQFRLYSSLIHYRPILPLILRFTDFVHLLILKSSSNISTPID